VFMEFKKHESTLLPVGGETHRKALNLIVKSKKPENGKGGGYIKITINKKLS